ncbi:VOC family protein [Marmoricola sp. URHA0025 HA25]
MESGGTRFKDLCLDALDPRAVAPFWSGALGLAAEYQDNGDAVLRGSEPGQTLWINTVPEPKTVKDRVHLDLHTDSVETLVAIGATVAPVQDDADAWTVMADPEDNELCAFVREPARVPAYKAFELVVDSADHVRIGQWWADVFGVELQHEDGEDGKDGSWLAGVPGFPMDAWVFGWVPEPKTVKNRLHWDLYGDVAELEARGATRLSDLPGWTVLADPEGNEFCVFPGS